MEIVRDGLKAALDSRSRNAGLVSWRNTFYLAHAIRSCSDTTTIYIYLCLRKTGLPQRWSLEMNKAYILTACSTVCHARRFLPYSASFIVSGLYIHIRTSLGGHLESHLVCTVRTASERLDGTNMSRHHASLLLQRCHQEKSWDKDDDWLVTALHDDAKCPLITESCVCLACFCPKQTDCRV